MEGLTLPFVISVVTALVSGVFAFIVLRRWWAKRRPHLLCWGVGLSLYFIGAATQAVLAFVWNPAVFGLWYWSGALAVAPWLGLGTVYLLVRKGNTARNLNMAILLMSVMTLPWTIFLTPFNEAAWYPGADMVTLYREIMPGGTRGTVRAFSPVMNGIGTVMLVGGALYSAHLFRRKQIMPNRVYGNWLIAAGALLRRSAA
ncbi:MAG: hypothetical protein HC828_11830 [Blastochloris sp.]|nr:hypothetical protein [Blastochloris sp.]